MQTESKSFIDTAINIFVVFNATGSIPLFVALLARYDHKKQMKIIIRECLIAMLTCLAFTFFGARILSTLSISKETIGIGGGLLLIIIALNMIFPKESEISKEDIPKKEPFIIPLAIPALAGPGTITALTFLSYQEGPFVASGAFILAWIPSLCILLAASYIKKILGDKGLLAVEKLGGMLICFIGIEIFTTSIIKILKDSLIIVK